MFDEMKFVTRKGVNGRTVLRCDRTGVKIIIPSIPKTRSAHAVKLLLARNGIKLTK